MKPSRLHIAFYNRSYFPDLTATGQLLTELCEHLVQDHDCRVSVVAGLSLNPVSQDPSTDRSRGLVRRERHNGVDILRAQGTRFPKNRFAGRVCNYISYFLSACWAGLRLRRPDVIVCLTDPPIIGLAGYLAARRFRVPLVMSYQDIFPEVARLLEDFDSPLVEWLLQRVNRFLASRADRVVALGETMRKRLIEGKGADPERTVVIPSWADCEAIRPAERNNPFTLRHQLESKFVVMHSGNIGLSQDLEMVLKAAPYLAHCPDIRMVFVGDGVQKERLQELAGQMGLENVIFLPFQPKETLSESFGSAHLFLISLKAGLAGYIVPSKVYGILASGRPFVAAVEEECEITEITHRYKCGIVAGTNDPRALADKILELHSNRKRLARLGRNARRAGLQFDRPLQVEAYYRLFRELVSVQPVRESRAKRLLDILLAGSGIVFSSPLWLLIALAVKLEDGGPVFYGHARVGKNGRVFKSWKFRSMQVDADQNFGPRQAAEDDPRITRVGKLLRATAMDELPQLVNIVRGEMSFVGPRALMPSEIEVRGEGEEIALDQIPGYRERHLITPGLTGIAQIFAPRDVPRRSKFRLDMLYFKRRNFWLDLKLIALSFWITFRGRWEHRGEKI